MYASAGKNGLGVMAFCDPMGPSVDSGDVIDLTFDESTGCWVRGGGGGSDPTALTPTVVTTPAAAPYVAPVRIDVPYQLPPLTVNAPAPVSKLTMLVVVGAALWGSFVVVENFVKSRRRGR